MIEYAFLDDFQKKQLSQYVIKYVLWVLTNDLRQHQAIVPDLAAHIEVDLLHYDIFQVPFQSLLAFWLPISHIHEFVYHPQENPTQYVLVQAFR